MSIKNVVTGRAGGSILAVGVVMLTVTNTYGYEMPPIRYWGDWGVIYREGSLDSGEEEFSENLSSININASSYIWRPWFALVNGGLSFTSEKTDSSTEPTAEEQFATGKVQVDVYPRSRFPFSVYAKYSRDQLDDKLYGNDVKTEEYGATQQYRSEDGKTVYNGRYDHRLRYGTGLQEVESDSLGFTMTNDYGNQSLFTEALFDEIDSPAENVDVVSYSVAARHSYDRGKNFNVENFASRAIIDTDYESTKSELDTSQFTSILSWRPAGSEKLLVSGSMRVSGFEQHDQELNAAGQFEDTSLKSDVDTVNISQGIIYNYSSNSLVNESINGNYVTTNDETIFTGTESISYTYHSDAIDSSWGNYSWNAESAVSNQHGDEESSEGLLFQLGHSLADDVNVSRTIVLYSNLSQQMRVNAYTDREEEKQLVHSWSLTWSEGSLVHASSVRLFMTDNRSVDDSDELFQLINLQVTKDQRLGRMSNWSGSLTLQKTRQRDKSNETRTQVINGHLGYRRLNLFGISKLKFRSDLTFSRQLSETERLIASANYEDDAADISWKNDFDYAIGKLVARLGIDYIKSNHEYDRLIMVQLIRAFGDF